MKALTFKDPGHRPVPPPDERSILLEQMRTEVSLNVNRNQFSEAYSFDVEFLDSAAMGS